MNKFYTLLAAAALTVLAAGAQTNTGLDQFSSWQPATGKINLDVNEQGVASVLFKLNGTPDRSADKFATLSRNGEVLSRVPVSNTYMLSYDSSYADVWQLVFFNGRQTITTQPGTYEVRIDEGFFLMGEAKTPSKEVVAVYTLPEPAFYVEPPQDASGKLYQYDSIQEWTITYGEAEYIELNPGAKLEIIDLYGHGENLYRPAAPANADAAEGDGEEGENPGLTPTEGLFPSLIAKGNQLIIRLDDPVMKPGTWKLEALSGLCTLHMADGKTSQSPEIHLFYFIPNFQFGKPEIFPRQGEITKIPGTIYLEMPGGTNVKNVNQMGICYLYPVDENGNKGDYIARYRAQKSKDLPLIEVELVNWNGADVDVEAAPGKYQLVTAEKLYSTVPNGGDNVVSYVSSMTFEYTIVPDVNGVAKMLTPEPGKYTSIKTIEVSFPEAETVKVEWTADPSTLKSATTTYAFVPKSDADKPNVAVFELPVAATMPGDYEFLTTIGAITVDGNPVVVAGNYTIGEGSGIECVENIVVMPEHFDIYDAQGILVAKNADMATLKALPAGLYIAAGKKFINK